MSIALRTRPTGPVLTLLGRNDCPTCQKVKETLIGMRLQQRTGIHWRFMDLTSPSVKLDFPVEVVPALHLQMPNGRAVMSDAKEMAENWGLEVWDPRAIAVWLRNALKQTE